MLKPDYSPQPIPEAIKLQSALAKDLKPWLKNSLELPPLTVKYVSRSSGLSVAEVLKLVSSSEFNFSAADGQIWKPHLITDLPETQRKTVIDTTRRNSLGKLVPAKIKKVEPIPQTLEIVRKLNRSGLNLKPKRLIRQSRYESRAPGGGPVVKAGFQQKNFSNQVVANVTKEMKIVFQAASSQPVSSLGRAEKTEIISQPIQEVIEWFKQQRRRKWLRGGNEQNLAGVLKEFSQWQPTDFILWNCFLFNWEQNPMGGNPLCTITNRLDTSIVWYFRERIQQMAEKLSLLGKPNLIILTPTSEATYDDIWNYTQTRQEKEEMINSSTQDLNVNLQTLTLPAGTTIQAMRWDQYLINRGVARKPDDYSLTGAELIQRLPNYQTIQQEAIRNELAYFQQYGIRVDKNTIVNNGIKYYGVYAGEGLALLGVKQLGTNVVLINLEEFRVAEMTALGSNNQIPIVTPVSHSEMMNYYRFQNETARKSKTGENL